MRELLAFESQGRNRVFNKNGLFFFMNNNLGFVLMIKLTLEGPLTRPNFVSILDLKKA